MNSTQKTFLSLISTTVLALTPQLAAAENTADVEQDKGYRAIIEQTGTFNEAVVRQLRTSKSGIDGVNSLILNQTGVGNLADIRQNAAAFASGHQLEVSQDGNDNTLDYDGSLFSNGTNGVVVQRIEQRGTNHNADINSAGGLLTVVQEGNNHTIQAGGTAINIEQVGDNTTNNYAEVASGSSAISTVLQQGNNTTAVIDAGNFSGETQIYQLAGSDGSYAEITSSIGSGVVDEDIITQSGANSVAIINDGAFSAAVIDQTASNSRAMITQQVSLNDAVIRQHGSFNDGVIVQGGGNNASIFQDGSVNRASIEQGNFAGDDVNTANINQFGDANSASVRQLSPNNVVNATQNGGSSLFVVQN